MLTYSQSDYMLQIIGSIKSFTFKKTSSGFAVARFVEKGKDAVTVAGNLVEFAEQEPLVLYGSWTEWTNPRTKEKVNQFKVEAAYREQPATLKGLEAFLATAVPGCGPVRAKQLVKKHGEELFNILRRGDINKLMEAKGVGASTASRISQGFRDKSLDYFIAEFLCSIGVNPDWAPKIRREMGPDAIRIIQKDPYKLTAVSGIGFKKADQIAIKLGWTMDSPERAEATLLYVLSQAGNEGHSYLPRVLLIADSLKELVKDPDVEPGDANDPTSNITAELQPPPDLNEDQLKVLLNSSLERAYEKKTLVRETANTSAGPVELAYLPYLYQAEVRLARKLRILLATRPQCRYTAEQLEWIVRDCEKGLEIELTDEQRSAIVKAFTEPVSILTGGPGTGKTACVRVLVNVAQKLGYSLSMCAPTGRAAKHLSNVTGEPALTIHMLLKYDQDTESWTKCENDPLTTGMVIADEFSMVDIEMAYRIFDAVKSGTPVLVLGDKDQLPAVSPGRVLEDLISSGKIPVTRLTKIFRQAEQSLIIQNAHRILNGDVPQFPAKKDDPILADCYLMEPPEIPALDGKGRQKKTSKGKPAKVEDYEWIKSRLLAMCKNRIPDRMRLDPIRDVQVLTPMKEKGLGVHALNEVLQDALNPKEGEGQGPDEVIIGHKRFRTGDRVQQHRNNYQLQVSNGDIGFITKIDNEEQLIHIDFYGTVIQYPYGDAKDDLQLGYCMSVHKAQGGEFPVVIVVLLRHNFIMLRRNLIYTAVTRAQQLLVFISQKWVLETAVKNAAINQRNSFLAVRLRRELEAKKEVAA